MGKARAGLLVILTGVALTYAQVNSLPATGRPEDVAEQASQPSTEARENLNQGIKAFTEQKYNEAAQFFEQAIRLDPQFEIARMYLAIAYTSQFIPGSPDPKGEEMAYKAIDTFKKLVENATNSASPNVKNSMLSIASLYYQLKKYAESKQWCDRLLETDPQNAEAHYRIAVLAFDYSLGKTGVQGELVPSMSPDERTITQAAIDEGLDSLEKALKIRPDYFDALEFQNLLLREKAKMEEDENVRNELIHQADLIAQKALLLRLKAQERPANPNN